MQAPTGIKLQISKTSNILIKVAAVVGAITVLAGGYTFYLNYVWKPTISVLEVDFTNGMARLKFGNKLIDLEGDATFLLGGDWGVRFGSVYNSGIIEYTRIELIRKNMVYEYLQK